MQKNISGSIKLGNKEKAATPEFNMLDIDVDISDMESEDAKRVQQGAHQLER